MKSFWVGFEKRASMTRPAETLRSAGNHSAIARGIHSRGGQYAKPPLQPASNLHLAPSTPGQPPGAKKLSIPTTQGVV